MIFLKLGGSLITDKSKPFTVNWSALETAAKSIGEIDDRLIVGHGGGSFGHFVAKEYEGFVEGFFKAREAMAKLNNIVVSSLIAKNIYAVGFPPSCFTICKGGEIEQMNYEALKMASPYCVAKGQDHIAERIKSIAQENDVSIVENKPLARELYRRVDIGDEIPEDLFTAVAEVLAFVYKLKERKAV